MESVCSVLSAADNLHTKAGYSSSRKFQQKLYISKLDETEVSELIRIKIE